MKLQSILGDDLFGTRSAQMRYPGLAMRTLILTVLGSLSYTRYYLQGGTIGGRAMILHDLLLWQTCFVPWAILCPMVWWVERRFPVERRRVALHFVVTALASIPICYLALEMTVLLAQVFEYLFSRGPSPMVFNILVRRDALLEEFLYWSIIAAGWTIRRYGEGREKERENARLALAKSELENSLRNAELEVLRMRLNPHFLFNTLQNISTLVRHEPQTADQMLIRLGDLLRASLRGNSTSEVTLDSELNLTRAYLDIEKLRFGDRLSIVVKAAPETELALVPTLLLQPLVENAIKHGLRTSAGGKIAIETTAENGRLMISVRDNGVGMRAGEPKSSDSGIGLSSTIERLARMYPDHHQFRFLTPAEGGTEIRITLPLRLEKPSIHPQSVPQYDA
jgi:two-component system, LytTR family, sensor kinase